MDASKELQMHIKDLARQAETRGTYTYSAFLSPADLSDILAREKDLIPVPYCVWDGAEAAEHPVCSRFVSASDQYFRPPSSGSLPRQQVYSRVAKSFAFFDAKVALCHFAPDFTP